MSCVFAMRCSCRANVSLCLACVALCLACSALRFARSSLRFACSRLFSARTALAWAAAAARSALRFCTSAVARASLGDRSQDPLRREPLEHGPQFDGRFVGVVDEVAERMGDLGAGWSDQEPESARRYRGIARR